MLYSQIHGHNHGTVRFLMCNFWERLNLEYKIRPAPIRLKPKYLEGEYHYEKHDTFNVDFIYTVIWLLCRVINNRHKKKEERRLHSTQ
jgi:hypothetical protein